MLTNELIFATMLLGNAIDAEDSVSRKMIPFAIVTVGQLIYKKHFHLDFGEYVQTN